MSRFANKTAVDVITLGNGDQVQVRQALTAEEAAILKRDLIHFEYQVGGDSDGRVVAKGGEWWLQNIQICQAYLVGWNFTDDEGQPVPYDAALVPTLTQETVEEIAKAIDDLQAERRELASKKGLLPSAK